MSCYCLLCSRASQISSPESRNGGANAHAAEWDWTDVEQTFALKHDHLLPITLSELIWSIFWFTRSENELKNKTYPFSQDHLVSNIRLTV